jgi:hypothetical protein
LRQKNPIFQYFPNISYAFHHMLLLFFPLHSSFNSLQTW